jgi:EmrB/QacA subfamily drug resistance transporter
MRKIEYKWAALAVTTIGSLMAAIDTTIVVLALPNMIDDLHSNLVTMTWVIVSYLIVSTVLQLTFGRMADMFGRVKMYNLGFIIFTAGSALCGLAPNDISLIAFRVVQGVGGAMLTANSMAILTEAFPENQRGQAMGISTITWGAGSVLGPVLGGVILAFASWRWIFWINLPIGIIGTLAAFFVLRDTSTQPRRERFDLRGAALFCVGLISVLFWMMNGISAGWLSLTVVPYLVVGVGAFVAFYIWEKRVPHPMLDLSLFANRQYAFSVAAAALQSLAAFAVNFLIIFYLQGVRGYSPLTAALLILPLPVLTSLIGPFAGVWTDRDRFKGTTPATVGLMIQILSLLLLVFLTPDTSYFLLAVALGLMGIGGALFWSPNTSTTMGAAPRNRLGVASATLNTMRNVGMVCSFVVALAVAAASMPQNLVNAVFLGTVGHLPLAISTAFTNGITRAFVASAIICLLALAFSLTRVSPYVTDAMEVASSSER